MKTLEPQTVESLQRDLAISNVRLSIAEARQELRRIARQVPPAEGMWPDELRQRRELNLYLEDSHVSLNRLEKELCGK